VSDAVPKLVTWRVLAPLLTPQGAAAVDDSRPDEASSFRVVCHEGSLDALLADLAAHRLDLVLSTSAAPADASLKVFSHLLGESELAFFAAPALAAPLVAGFPRSLDHAPMLMPTDRSASRRVLDAWFEAAGVTPLIVGEFDDSALIKTLGQHGVGVFVAPAAISAEITEQQGVIEMGRLGDLRAKFYAITTERRIKHPAVAILTTVARTDLFSAENFRAATRSAPSARRPARPAS
jgi:LysR family transcriptional activator of nhaA